jgi:hypothetical protein
MRMISECTYPSYTYSYANFGVFAFKSVIQTSSGVDLTRSQLYGSSKNTTKVIPVNGQDGHITIDTQRTMLVIIDMQSESICAVY